MPSLRSTISLFSIGLLLVLSYPGLGQFEKQAAKADFLNPDSSHILPPTNVGTLAAWQGGKSVSTVHWAPSANAVSYSVYMDDAKIGSGITSTSFGIDTSLAGVGNSTFAVTATDASGNESIPSNLTYLVNAGDPNNPPSWAAPGPPQAPSQLSALPDWNLGKPRIELNWTAPGDADTYNIYRDGKEIWQGMWDFTYIDSDVAPGSTHTYTITGSKNYYPGDPESAQSAPITVTALSAQAAFSATPIEITKVIPDDDSAKVFFKTIPGAHDYRVYNLANLNSTKYAGEFGTGRSFDMIKNGVPALAQPTEESIEMNGLSPTGADLVVEAVDKPGPFQKADGFAGPGSSFGTSINGQADPSNIPNAIARSHAFHVTMHPFQLNGSQAFTDTFRNEQALQSVPYNNISLPIRVANGNPDGTYNYFLGVEETANNKWTIRQYLADIENTRNFFMGSHFMDTMYDGPSSSGAFSHNNNSSNVMIPNSTQDISDGKVLHVTMEVDVHDTGRRWTDILVGQAGDPLLAADPSKQEGNYVTVSGNLFVWEIGSGGYALNLIRPDPNNPGHTTTTDLLQFADYADQFTTDRSIYQQVFNGVSYANGSQLGLDNRSKFDLYLSSNHYRIVETEPDGTQLVREKDFPAGVTLPFTNTQTYYVHELYHTLNDRGEQMGDPNSEYWVNYRPYSDERHWDNMGQEVLNSFGSTPTPPASYPPDYADVGLTPSPAATPTPTPTPTATPTPIVTPAPTTAPTTSDDFNGDGKVTLADVVIAIQAYNQSSPTTLTQSVFTQFGHKPTLANLVSVFHQFTITRS